ncbi:hypothetical protein RB195_020650 [Necator americanus]
MAGQSQEVEGKMDGRKLKTRMSKDNECQLIMENSNTGTKGKLITYVDKLTWIMNFICIWFPPSIPKWRRVLNLTICLLSFTLVIYGMAFEMYVLYRRGFVPDLVTSTTTCGIIWSTQALISGIFLVHWQLSGKFFQYLSNTVVHQKGEYIARGRGTLNGGDVYACAGDWRKTLSGRTQTAVR